jgi:hypothetical protein
MEPARGIGPRLSPYHGDVLPLPLSRHELGKRDSDAHLGVSRTPGLPVTPFPIRSLLPDPNWDLPRTRRTRFRLRQGGESRAPQPILGGAVMMTPGSYARGESDPHQPGSRPGPSTHERMEPPPGVEPGLRPYGGRAASRARRHGCPPWIRTTIAGSRVQASCRLNEWASGAEGASRTRKRLILSKPGMPVPFTPARVRRPGLEPGNLQVKNLLLCHCASGA